MSLSSINLLHLTVLRYSLEKYCIGQGHYGRPMVKSRSHHVTHLQPPANVPTKYQLYAPCIFRYIAQSRFYRSRSIQAGQSSNQRSDHDNAHLHVLTIVPTTYQLSTPYSCEDIARIIFYRSRLLQLGQRSNQGQTMTLHTYNPN